MVQKYIKRSLEPVLKKAAAEFPAVILTGPRQAGKTTLLQQHFGKRFRYASLEPPDIRALANEDPRSFLKANPPPVIFDEIQYAPDLLPYIKETIDLNRHKNGQFLLTGSQNILLMEQATESLAGRAAILRLLPLSHREASGQPGAPLPWESEQTLSRASNLSYHELWNEFLRGSYPELTASPERDINLYLRKKAENTNTGITDKQEGAAFSLHDVERSMIFETLKKNDWNRSLTAAQMGIHPSTLWRKIKRLNINIPRRNGRTKNH